MTLRAFASVTVVAACVLSCSSKETPPPSGGAAFQLQGADPSAAGMLSTSCPESGRDFIIAITGDDGKPKLIVDGVDDARVKCQIDDTHFEISISNKNAALSVAGQYAGLQSTNSKAVIVTPGGSYATTPDQKCQVDFNPGSEGSTSPVGPDGKVFANFKCPAIKVKNTDTACGVNWSPGSKAYFQFSNCTGF